jgi:hypothetical protein
MNEVPKVGDLAGEEAYRAHQGRTAARFGVEAIERELHGETTDVVEIALYINGRMIHTKTDHATVARIIAILTGMGG